MKVSIKKFAEKFELEVNGTEDWLDNIYSFFPFPKNAEKPTIVAKLSLSKVTEEFLQVKGNVSYKPFVDCSRCGIKIPWQIADTFDLFYQIKNKMPLEDQVADLSKDSVEENYLVDGQLDVEELINDRIHLSIPQRTIPAKKEGSSDCVECDENLDESMVYGLKPEDDPSNPFAVLKKLQKPN